ncbi:MAG TPA: hypothetical protein VMV14_04560 [Acidimicrobiales bacterium]|nr:hypothetical protein [Acidimicrobiales bacterium]
MTEPTQPTRPSADTRDAEHAEAQTNHESDRAPTSQEEAAAEAQEVDSDVAEHEKEMLKRGANQEGEGRLP